MMPGLYARLLAVSSILAPFFGPLRPGAANRIRIAQQNHGPRRMTNDEILAEFRAAGALLEGHFILSSGLRSPRYLQCARVLMNPSRGARLASALAATLPATLRAAIDVVV